MNLTGTWEGLRQYESDITQYESAHTIDLVQSGATVSGQSQAEGAEGSVVRLELGVHDNELRGSWTERAAEGGTSGGRVFEGLLHLAIDPTGNELSGVWTGASRSGKIKCGPWVLKRLVEKND